MAQISFYLFENSTERQVESACRLCRKILNQHPHIWWYCADPELQTELDEQLWTFDPQSFIPHGIHQPHSSVCISEQLPPSNDWIVFNFNNHALEQTQDFRHIIEIIENNETAKQAGRPVAPVAGTAWLSGAAKGATGRPVPLLMQFLANRIATNS